MPDQSNIFSIIRKKHTLFSIFVPLQEGLFPAILSPILLSMADIPKIIWMLWLQGEENLPPLVRACYDSWKRLNPTWEVRLLDESSIATYLDIPPYLAHPHLPPQAKADLIRIFLLETYGGVWADASVFCAKPLDTWIDSHTPRGFFAFSRPRQDKLLSNWFLISTADNAFIREAAQAARSFWERGPVLHKQISRVYHKINHILYPWGLDGFVKRYMWQLKRIGLYPYFWFHFLSLDLYKNNTDLAMVWNSVPKISSHIPQKLQSVGLLSPITPELATFIQSGKSPVHKLNWRTDITHLPQVPTVISTLLKETHTGI